MLADGDCEAFDRRAGGDECMVVPTFFCPNWLQWK